MPQVADPELYGLVNHHFHRHEFLQLVKLHQFKFDETKRTMAEVFRFLAQIFIIEPTTLLFGLFFAIVLTDYFCTSQTITTLLLSGAVKRKEANSGRGNSSQAIIIVFEEDGLKYF